jgi:hypothetical protein
LPAAVSAAARAAATIAAFADSFTMSLIVDLLFGIARFADAFVSVGVRLFAVDEFTRFTRDLDLDRLDFAGADFAFVRFAGFLMLLSVSIPSFLIHAHCGGRHQWMSRMSNHAANKNPPTPATTTNTDPSTPAIT